MIKFAIDTTEIDKLAEMCPVMRGIIEEELAYAMEESGMLLTAMVAGRTPKNYGFLRSSIVFPGGYEVRGTPASAYTGTIRAAAMSVPGVSPHEYVNHVEFGTRPHFPPIGPLRLWAARKGFDDDAAYAIQQHIGKHGTEGAKMFERAWNEGGKSKVDGFFQAIPVKAIRRFSNL